MTNQDLGRVYWEALSNRDTVSRRVESVQFESLHTRRRRVSLDLDLAVLGEIYRGIAGDLLIPLLLHPKGLIYDFDLTINGNITSAASRRADSVVAAEILLHLGTLKLCGDLPPASAREFLVRLCKEFPDGGSIAERVAREGLSVALQKSEAAGQLNLEPAALDWLQRAADYEQWRVLAERLSREYVVVASIQRELQPCIVKIQWLEAAVESEVGDLELDVSLPDVAITARIFGTGRSASEHYRIVAPSQMFFSGGFLFRRAPGEVTYFAQSAVDRLAFYTNDAPAGDLVIAASLSPSTRGFVAPARLFTAWMFVSLVLGAIAGWGNRLESIHDVVEAAVVLVLFTPTVGLAYLFAADEHEIRWNALKYWRYLCAFATLPLLGAVVMLFLDPTVYKPGVLKWAWTGAAAVNGLLTLVIWILTAQLTKRERLVVASQNERREWTVAFGS